MNDGFIKLYRSLENHWLLKASKKKSYFEAWILFLFWARFKPGKVMFRRSLVYLERGQFVTSYRSLMREFGWSSTSRVDHFLKIMREDGMLHIYREHSRLIISICNYDTWQEPAEFLRNTFRTLPPSKTTHSEEAAEHLAEQGESIPAEHLAERSAEHLTEHHIGKLSDLVPDYSEDDIHASGTVSGTDSGTPSGTDENNSAEHLAEQTAQKTSHSAEHYKKKDTGNKKKDYKKKVAKKDFRSLRVTSDMIETIYQEYPKKAAKGAAFDKIKLAVKWVAATYYDNDVKKAGNFLVKAIRKYVARKDVQELIVTGQKQYIPHPATWFNQQRYLDEDTLNQEQGDMVNQIKSVEQAKQKGYMTEEEANEYALEKHGLSIDKVRGYYSTLVIDGKRMYKKRND